MKRPGRTSIRRRLLWLSTAVSLLTLGVAGGLFLAHDMGMLRQQMVRDLEVLASVIGDGCLGALAFEVPETAEKTLANLRHEYQIRQAILYAADGAPFARYRRDPEHASDPPRLSDAGVLVDVSPLGLGLGTVEVRRDLILDGQHLGQILIQARTDELAAQWRRYMRSAALLLLATLAVSLILAWRLQRRIADPILRLAGRTREISAQGNYAPRLTLPEADDELTDLYQGFNAMLDQIERREQELERIRASLEQRVAERTRDLDLLLREQRLMLEALPLGVTHLVARRIARINPRVTELFGWSEAELLEAGAAPFYADPADFAEVGRLGYARMAAGGVYRTDRLLRRKDGSCFWGRLIGQAIDPNDERLGSLWIIDDIDLEKAMEARLQQAREAAESASRAKDAFLANMSHELRTPLNAVLGFAQILEGDPRLTPGQREPVEGIRRGGQRLLGLIDEILDLARIESGSLELLPVEWESRAFLRELDAMFRARAETKGLRLRVEAAPRLPRYLRGDAKRLNQILVNLIDNALKYTDSGEIRVQADFIDGRLRLEIADSGAGIPNEDLGRIFEPFHQLGEIGRRPQGTGLGLAICKQLVACLDGTLSVESTLGVGTTFRIGVAAEAIDQDAREEPTEPLAGRLVGHRRLSGQGPLRILVVDDERENREVLRGLLEPLGFAVAAVADGPACLAHARNTPPDLILMDLRLPGMDGLEITRRLRREPATRTIPIIAVTAAAFEEDRVRAIAAGCNDHLGKPVLSAALYSILARRLPLEWRYAEQEPDPDADPDTRGLAPETREHLIALTRSGSVTAIADLAERLADEDGCPLLARRLSTLAQSFDMAGLRRLAARLETERTADIGIRPEARNSG
jgi:PAS domain S-box-containing protein